MNLPQVYDLLPAAPAWPTTAQQPGLAAVGYRQPRLLQAVPEDPPLFLSVVEDWAAAGRAFPYLHPSIPMWRAWWPETVDAELDW